MIILSSTFLINWIFFILYLGDVVESPTGERPNQKGYSSPTGGRKGGGNNGGNNGSRRGGNGSTGGRRPKPQTGYGAPNGDEGLPPLASYGK